MPWPWAPQRRGAAVTRRWTAYAQLCNVWLLALCDLERARARGGDNGGNCYRRYQRREALSRSRASPLSPRPRDEPLTSRTGALPTGIPGAPRQWSVPLAGTAFPVLLSWRVPCGARFADGARQDLG